jgi:glucan phosphoethanolaminetransferase (alkaline phosphatase superfamily)
MYNFAGIKFYYLGKAILYSILTIGLIVLLKICKKLKEEKTPLKIKILIILCVVQIIYFVLICQYKISNPNISTYTGEFIERHNDKHTFWNGDGKKQVFDLILFTKDEVYSDDFEKNKEYKIYFDESTHIIVGVEPVD